MLNDNERKKYETISKVINGEMTRKEASVELDLSLRQIDKLKKKYLITGKDAFIHGNRGKPNANKKDDTLINELEELYLKDFYDFNFEQFYERIFGKYDISYDTMLKRFTQDGILSPLAHKKTLKDYKEMKRYEDAETLVNTLKSNTSIDLSDSKEDIKDEEITITLPIPQELSISDQKQALESLKSELLEEQEVVQSTQKKENNLVSVKLRNPDIILTPITDEEKNNLKVILWVMRVYMFYIDYQILKEFILV